jgi:ATP phosphoribosyltransferase
MLESIDASLQGKSYSQVTVNICAADMQDVAQRLAQNPLTRGLQGPTIAPIYTRDSHDENQWFTVTLILANKQLLQAVDHLRASGATDVVVSPIRYLFWDHSPTYRQLSTVLGL